MRQLACLALLAGCLDVNEVHHCRNDMDCIAPGHEGGRCEVSGYCSLPDPSCGIGNHRYHDMAGDHSGMCVVRAQEPTQVGPLLLDADRTETTCGSAGARDAYVEFVTALPQVIVFDIADSSAQLALAIREGACPGGSQLDCTARPCGDTPYSRVAATVGVGTYCIVIEEASAVTAGSVTLRAFPGGREAVALDGSPITGTTCMQPAQTMPSCADMPGTEAAYVFATCPNPTRLSAMVDPASTLDVVLSLRAKSALGAESKCENEGMGGGLRETLVTDLVEPGPYYLIVDRAGGDACGSFQLTSSTTAL